MWLTRALRIVRTEAPIIKKHTNEITGIVPEKTDKAWGRRKVKMMTAHAYGRSRNCYRIASRFLIQSLTFHTKNRAAFRRDFAELNDTRIEAGVRELQYDPFNMRESLARLHIGLDRKSLANFAMFEPRTFRSIVALCAHKEAMPLDKGGLGKETKAGPDIEVISRGHL